MSVWALVSTAKMGIKMANRVVGEGQMSLSPREYFSGLSIRQL